MARTVGFDEKDMLLERARYTYHIECHQATLCDNSERRLEGTTIFYWICQVESSGEHPIAAIGPRWRGE